MTIGSEIVAFGEPSPTAPGNLYGILGEIDGLYTWLEKPFTVAPPQVNYQISYNANPPEDIHFPSLLSEEVGENNTIFFRAKQNRSVESFYSKNVAVASSEFGSATSWRNGIDFLEALQELLTISGDRYVRIHSLQAKITPAIDDKVKNALRWVHVLHQFKDTEPDTSEKNSVHFSQHLIRFSHLGTEGYAKWLKVRKDYARVITPLMNLYKLKDPTVDQEILLTGIALEALAYNLRLRKDECEESIAAHEQLYKRFPRIVDELSPIHARHFLGSWADDMKDAYNGVKHANRALPPLNELAELAEVSKTVLRAWLALELGISPAWVNEKLIDSFRLTQYTLRSDPSELLP